jgi:hypothetical protein
MALLDKNGNPIAEIGGIASATVPAAVDAGKPVAGYWEPTGQLHVIVDYANGLVPVSQYASADTTIQSGFGVTVPGFYEILSGYALELASGAYMDIT